jgi:hypothetical protein
MLIYFKRIYLIINKLPLNINFKVLQESELRDSGLLSVPLRPGTHFTSEFSPRFEPK